MNCTVWLVLVCVGVWGVWVFGVWGVGGVHVWGVWVHIQEGECGCGITH